MAAAQAYVPASIRSAMMACSAPCRRATPATVSRSVPTPVMRAPMAFRHSARSAISGSRAALASTVSPSARLAASSRFSVAPTETKGNTMFAPLSRPPRGTRPWT